MGFWEHNPPNPPTPHTHPLPPPDVDTVLQIQNMITACRAAMAGPKSLNYNCLPVLEKVVFPWRSVCSVGHYCMSVSPSIISLAVGIDMYFCVLGVS